MAFSQSWCINFFYIFFIFFLFFFYLTHKWKVQKEAIFKEIKLTPTFWQKKSSLPSRQAGSFRASSWSVFNRPGVAGLFFKQCCDYFIQWYDDLPQNLWNTFMPLDEKSLNITSTMVNFTVGRYTIKNAPSYFFFFKKKKKERKKEKKRIYLHCTQCIQTLHLSY